MVTQERHVGIGGILPGRMKCPHKMVPNQYLEAKVEVREVSLELVQHGLPLIGDDHSLSSRPSELMAIEDPVMALAFDLASARRALELKDGESKEPAQRICL